MNLRQELTDLAGSLAAPLRALLITLAGVWLSWKWLNGAYFVVVAIVLGIIFAAYLLDGIGRRILNTRPTLGLVLMEWWIAAPLALGAAAAATIVIIAVKLWMPETASVEVKELVGAISAGLTTFLTSAFITWAGEHDASRLAERIKRAFFEKFKRADPNQKQLTNIRYFKAESKGELLVYAEFVAGVQGWGREARHKRASELAEELRTGSSNP